MCPKIDSEASRRRRDAEAAELRTIPQKLLSEKKASHIYGMSVSWFRRKRADGNGPKVTSVGRSVRYHIDDLESYFNSPP